MVLLLVLLFVSTLFLALLPADVQGTSTSSFRSKSGYNNVDSTKTIMLPQMVSVS